MMKRWIISLMMAMVAGLAWCSTMECQDSIDIKVKAIADRLDSIQARVISLKEKVDSAENERYMWEQVTLRKGWSINDTSIHYPPVIGFGVKTYRWLNHALNYYDTTYVVNPGRGKKRFKVMLKINSYPALWKIPHMPLRCHHFIIFSKEFLNSLDLRG